MIVRRGSLKIGFLFVVFFACVFAVKLILCLQRSHLSTRKRPAASTSQKHTKEKRKKGWLSASTKKDAKNRNGEAKRTAGFSGQAVFLQLLILVGFVSAKSDRHYVILNILSNISDKQTDVEHQIKNCQMQIHQTRKTHITTNPSNFASGSETTNNNDYIVGFPSFFNYFEK